MPSSQAARPPSRRGCLFACAGILAIVVLGCCVVAAAALLLRSFRPTARDLYSGAPDLVAGQSVSAALVDAGVQGASVLVIPIKDSAGQIAIITLDESQGFAAGADSLQVVIGNIVNANRAGDLGIQQLSIDYRDQSGASSLAFAASMDRAEAYADGRMTRQQFMGEVQFDLADTLRYYGVDQVLEGGQEP